MPSLYTRFAADLDAVLNALLPESNRGAVTVEPPRDASHGDLSTNAAMVLAKPASTNPRALADQLRPALEALPYVAGVEIAGPGFINLRLNDAVWREELDAIVAEGGEYGRSAIGAGSTVNVEYVSANPTGPMHMGHCRGAVVGDALAGLLEFAGHKVIREYYVNDAGGQVDTLARSVHLRYRQKLEGFGPPKLQYLQDQMPGGFYPGEYLIPVASALVKEFGDQFILAPESEWLPLFRTRTVAAMLEQIRADLALLGIRHDRFASEADVQARHMPEQAEAKLRAEGLVYDGVLEAPKGKTAEDWEPVELPLFRSTQFGDDQDRPIRKSDGSWTYFGADMAYHWQKSADADALIDVWGADHAGTVKRIRAAVQALTGGKPFDVKLIQMVRLLRAGEPVKMSKRSGNFVTLAEVVEEVGKDVVRFTMLSRKADAQMDFDFAKVVEATKDNPVFYVQYAHARIASLGRKAAELGVAEGTPDLGLLGDADLAIVKLAAQFPRIVESAAGAREPHRIAFYLYDLAAAFHGYWHRGNDDPRARVLVADDHDLTRARLFLSRQIGQVIANGLGILGVTPAESM